jgi:hypothetical protein
MRFPYNCRDRMTTLPPDFFLFQDTDYDFPHGDCDMRTSAELQTYFLSSRYLCCRILSHYRTRLGVTKDVESLLDVARRHEALRICGEAFMRLKFALEIMNLGMLRRKLLPAYKKPKSPFMKEPLSAIWEWEANATENYSQIDAVANRLFLYIIETLKGIVAGAETGDTENNAWVAGRLGAFAAMNADMPKIRSVPCDAVLWDRFIASDLCGFAYCMLVLKLWSVILPMLSSS